LKLETAIEYMNGLAPAFDPALLEREVGSFAIDSREVSANTVFFALSQPEYRDNGFNGEFDDSTRFVRAALNAGAVAAVLREDRFAEHKLEEFRDRIIFVDDSIAALQRLAHGVYSEWDRPVVAITGSAGKTTAKELTAHVLALGGKKVLRNIKNFNNGLGHPLTVLRLAADNSFDVAVLEMGMSTPMNEIRRLCRITPPDIAVELNVLPVHVEHLGSIENVAKAKAELIEGMKEGGTAVLNADDPRVAAMSSLSRGQVVTFGIENPGDVMAANLATSGLGQTRFTLKYRGEEAEVAFPLNGKHNILNALAAAAVGTCFGMSVNDIAGALESVEAPPQRGVVTRFKGDITVIDDSYNSNPDALLSMVRTFLEVSKNAKRRIVAAGEMRELGPEEASIHFATGQKLADPAIDELVGIGGSAAELVTGARAAGVSNAQFVGDSEEAAGLIAGMVREGDFILVKGSRGVKTEKVVQRLIEKFEVEGEV
jgi:UDP-N-acetylmuramoyl-tripeptide--D-alanyl-D-alanine ligase